jgi:hypothetical protein
VVSGVERISSDRINGARSLGASGWQLFVYVIFPSCLPEIFTGLRTAIGVSYSTLGGGEMVAATSGIGWMVLDASKFLRKRCHFRGHYHHGVGRHSDRRSDPLDRENPIALDRSRRLSFFSDCNENILCV